MSLQYEWDEAKAASSEAKHNVTFEEASTVNNVDDDLLPEHRFDYSKARPNRFAGKNAPGSRLVTLDPDVAEVFTTPESVNTVLRALILTMPRNVQH